MASTAILAIRIISDAKGAQKGVDQLSGRMGKLQSAVSKAAIPAAVVGGALVGVGIAAVKSASRLQQAQGAVESVFGASSKAVQNYASTSAERMGLAQSAYLEFASLTGSALMNAGFSAEKSADMTDKAMQRGADMAATFGGTTEQAMDAINAAIARGEFDPIEKYGVSLNQTAINAELAARGQDKLTGQAAKMAKAQVTYDLIMQQTAKTAGQFAREADTAAGSQAIMTAKVEDARAALGTALLPVVARVMSTLAGMAEAVGKNSTLFLTLAGVAGSLSGIILALNAAFKVHAIVMKTITAATNLWNNSTLILRARLIALAAAEKAQAIATNIAAAATKVWALATRLLNAAFVSSPIGWIVLAIAALVAVIVLIATRTNWFQRIWAAAWGAIKAAASAVVGWFRGPFVSFFTKTIPNTFKNGWNAAKNWTTNLVNQILTWVKGIPGKIKTGLGNLLGFVRDAFKNAFQKGKDFVISVATSIITWVKGIPGRIKNNLSSLLGNVRDIFRNAFNAAKTAVSNGITAIMDAIKAVPGKIKNVGSSMLSAGKDMAGKVIDGIKNAFKGAGGIASDVASAVKGAVNSVLNLPLTFGPIKLPGPVPDIPKVTLIPRLAAGGIITSPTLALIGEAGPEAVVPLDQYPTGGGDVIVYIELDGTRIGPFISKRVDQAMAGQARRIRLRAAV